MNRELDVKVAKAKGFNVVGETICLQYPEMENEWYIVGREWNEYGQIQPVYVSDCHCDELEEPLYNDALENGIICRILGHINECLDVVPFWSSDLSQTFALVAEMEQDKEIALIDFSKYNDADSWACIIRFKNDDFILQYANTLQVAVCNAYLEWHNLTIT